MTEFMYLLRGGNEKMATYSPEEMQKHMADWGAWMESLAKNETLVKGAPLSREGRTISGGGSKVMDAPYTEPKEMVGGYIIVNAENLDEATEISKGCPIHDAEGVLEIREVTPM